MSAEIIAFSFLMVNVKSEGQAIQWNQSIIQWINKAKRSFIYEKYEDKSNGG